MTLKLEVGKTYKRRDGVIIDIVELVEGGIIYPFRCDRGQTYTPEGEMFGTKDPSPYDIVSEVKPETPSPVRTVTRKEVVPGVYGNVKAYINGAGKIGAEATCLDKDNIREAIATLTLIADALENGDETTS